MTHSTSPPAPQPAPGWYHDGSIYEAEFCDCFLTEHRLFFFQGAFFDINGRIADESALRRDILWQIRPYCSTNLARRVSGIMDLLRIQAGTDQPPMHLDRIHVANGTLFLTERAFTTEKDLCLNRLPVAYRPDAPRPELWLSFIEQLLYPEDIPTLQEYMGYCLIPSTKGQAMLLLTGNGGEGKSCVGLVMRSLLGSNMCVGSIAKVECNRFARADLEHQLLMVDDDLALEALKHTHVLKCIITSEQPIDLERKGQQSFQGQIYARFLAFGNGNLRALNDHSDGFFRRLITISVQRRDPDRVDDPYLADKLSAETEGIFLWCLEGLERLLGNNYHFTLSQRTQENTVILIQDENNVPAFLGSSGYIEFASDAEITSKKLYDIYLMWCSDNALTAYSSRKFSDLVMAHLTEYGLTSSNNIHSDDGRRVRGFLGVRSLI